MPSVMMPKTACAGVMTAMERLFACGSATEPSGDEAAHDRAVLRMVQREMDEADEANLLEEEDMHVFDREPLSDRLSVVSCNYCKKPIKASQYMAHAERCRSFSASDEALLELDGGTGPKKPPRKARKKFFSAHDNQSGIGDAEGSQSIGGGEDVSRSELATVPGIVADGQVAAVSASSMLRVPKRIMNLSEGAAVESPKALRSQKAAIVFGADAVQVDGAGTPINEATSGAGPSSAGFSEAFSVSKRTKINVAHPFLTLEELDLICGVLSSDSVTCCRQPLNCKVHSEFMKRSVIGRRQSYDMLIRDFKDRDSSGHFLKLRSWEQHDTVIPPPLATKVYRFRHHHQMRAVLGYLFHEAVERANSSAGTSPNSTMGDQSMQPGIVSYMPSDGVVHDLQHIPKPPVNQKKIMNQTDMKLSPVQGLSAKSVQLFPQPMEMGYSGAKLPTPILANLQQDSQLPVGTTKTDTGHSAVLRSRVMQASQLLAISSPGSSLNSIQQSPLGSVHVT